MVKNIIFDFDGTVYDTVEGITKCVRYAINKIGLDSELDSLRKFAGPPLQEMFRETFSLSEDEAIQAVADFRERYVPIGVYESSVFPGMPELLRDLKNTGYKLGIATSKPQALAEQLMTESGIIAYFDAITGSTPGSGNDSKELILRKTMDKLNADPAQTLMVGDTKYDVLGAKDCGVRCLGVGYGYAANGELSAAGADCIVDDIDALRSFLLGAK